MRRNISRVSTSPACFFCSVAWLCSRWIVPAASRMMSTCEPWRGYVVVCSGSVLLSSRSLFICTNSSICVGCRNTKTLQMVRIGIWKVQSIDRWISCFYCLA
uniref:Secreted protein n=1 Tax=Zea mays TaxID=4577 RepID=B6T5G8_MAIZE|nr:hypothetical protein [Zea mays]